MDQGAATQAPSRGAEGSFWAVGGQEPAGRASSCGCPRRPLTCTASLPPPTQGPAFSPLGHLESTVLGIKTHLLVPTPTAWLGHPNSSLPWGFPSAPPQSQPPAQHSPRAHALPPSFYSMHPRNQLPQHALPENSRVQATAATVRLRAPASPLCLHSQGILFRVLFSVGWATFAQGNHGCAFCPPSCGSHSVGFLSFPVGRDLRTICPGTHGDTFCHMTSRGRADFWSQKPPV